MQKHAIKVISFFQKPIVRCSVGNLKAIASLRARVTFELKGTFGDSCRNCLASDLKSKSYKRVPSSGPEKNSIAYLLEKPEQPISKRICLCGSALRRCIQGTTWQSRAWCTYRTIDRIACSCIPCRPIMTSCSSACVSPITCIKPRKI
jgi:hypothetical protein